MSLEHVAVLLVVCMTPFATWAAILYLAFFPWRQDRDGWAFANVIVSFALLIDLAVLYQFAPAFPGKAVVKVVLYALILAGQVQLAVSLSRLVYRNRRRNR